MTKKTYMGYEYDEPENEEPVLEEFGEILGSTRFDLEQKILDCWTITNDLDLVYDNIMGNGDLTKNDIADLLLGIRKLYEMKFQKVSDVFDELLQTGDLR